jgi:hypothetical protein
MALCIRIGNKGLIVSARHVIVDTTTHKCLEDLNAFAGKKLKCLGAVPYIDIAVF